MQSFGIGCGIALGWATQQELPADKGSVTPLACARAAPAGYAGPPSQLKPTLDEGDALSKIAIVVLALIQLGSAAVLAEDSDFTGPAPTYEIERANQYMISRFGQTFFESSVRFVSSGLIGSGQTGEVIGYFAAYHFCPRSAVGSYAAMVIESERGSEYRSMVSAEIPDCVTHPEYCDVQISPTKAIEIALANGLGANLGEIEVRLFVGENVPGFVWRVAKKWGKSRPVEGRPVVVVDAHTGVAEMRYDGEEPIDE